MVSISFQDNNEREENGKVETLLIDVTGEKKSIHVYLTSTRLKRRGRKDSKYGRANLTSPINYHSLDRVQSFFTSYFVT